MASVSDLAQMCLLALASTRGTLDIHEGRVSRRKRIAAPVAESGLGFIVGVLSLRGGPTLFFILGVVVPAQPNNKRDEAQQPPSNPSGGARANLEYSTNKKFHWKSNYSDVSRNGLMFC
jgi:hypothetical protein